MSPSVDFIAANEAEQALSRLHLSAHNQHHHQNELQAQKQQQMSQMSECPFLQAAAGVAQPEISFEHDAPPPSTHNIVSGQVQLSKFMPRTFPLGCEKGICHASTMDKSKSPVAGVDRPPEVVFQEAEEFIREMYHEKKLPDERRDERIAEIKEMIRTKGFYYHTSEELSFGVQTSWRNARRCVQRSQWQALETIDRRDVHTADGMLEACFSHLRYASNGGRIRPTMTIFPQKLPGRDGPRIWNGQLTEYAGYRMPDGTVRGDSMNLEMTKRCIELGWVPPEPKGRFDRLPVVVVPDGGEPVWREVPEDCVIEVKIRHPASGMEWFEELGLQWRDHPPVCYFVIQIGGIDYTGATFSGWYLSTEIASRNLSDEHRYNALPEIAKRMGLSMANRSLWKDRAVLELNQAVLYSFDKAGVTLVDHHSAADSFVNHYNQEIKGRGHCPGDWVWLTPPMSSGQTKIFHQEMYSYLIKPAILPFPERSWHTYWRRKGITPPSDADLSPQSDTTLSATDSRAVRIAYGTETGTAERLAKVLRDVLREKNFRVVGDILELDDLAEDVKNFNLKGTLVVVTSTFGEGEPPANARVFKDVVQTLVKQHGGTGNDPLSALRYAVFGLGSSLYPDTLHAFPCFVDSGLHALGARRIVPVGRADDTRDVDPTGLMEKWVGKLAIAYEVGTEDMTESTDSGGAVAADAGLTARQRDDAIASLKGYVDMKVVQRRKLFDNGASGAEYRATYHIELEAIGDPVIRYDEGDHVALLPFSKSSESREVFELLGSRDETFYGATVFTYIHQWVDLHAKPSAELLNVLKVDFASSALDALRQTTLDFSSLPSLSSVLFALPLKRPRYFSVASTPLFYRSSIHLTVAQLPNGQISVPVCTWPLGDDTPLVVQASVKPQPKYHLPMSPSASLILIGGGTGVAPLRAFLQARRARICQARVTVFAVMSFRTRSEHLYSEELDFQTRLDPNSGVSITVVPVYTREEPFKRIGAAMDENAELVSDLFMSELAHIFICGAHGLRTEAEQAILSVLVKTGKAQDIDAAQELLSAKRKAGHFVSDTYVHSSSATPGHTVETNAKA